MSLKTDNPYDDKFKGGNPPMMQGVSHLMGSIHRGRGLDFGNSEFDEGLNWAADIDENDVQGSINEYRAQNQPWAYKFGAGVGRAALKAGTEIAKLPGVIGGIAAAGFQEEGEGFDMAFNNAWIRSIDNFSEEAKQEYLPVYVKKAVQEGNLWDNISSIDFWATDGADGIGFIAAMMAPGAIIEGLNVGSKLVSSASKLAKTTGMMDKVRKAEGILGQVGANISKITPKGINSVASVTANTIFEAGAEAKGVSDSITADANRKLELGRLGQPGGITQEQYDYIMNVQRPEAMRDTFITNAAILVGPNAIMHKAIWGKGADKLTRTTDNIKDRIIASGNRYAKATASEGFFEEGLQTTAENYFKEKALKGELGSGFEMKDIGDFAKSYIDTVSSTEGQKAIFLGGVFGGGMTSFQGRKSDVKDRQKTNDILDNIDISISGFKNDFDDNIYIKDDNNNFIFEKDEEGNDTTKRKVDPAKVLEVARSLGYTEEQSAILDLALQTGNTEVLNNIKEQAIFNLVLPAIHNGKAGLQALKEKLDSDSQFQEILERDQSPENKTKTVDFKNKVLEQAAYLQAENEKFKNFSKEVITLNNPKASESDKEDYLNILNANYLNAKNKLFNNNKTLAQLEQTKKDVIKELNINPALSDTEFESNTVLFNENISKNGLLKTTLDKINKLTNENTKLQKDISEIWKGDGNVEKSFNNFIKDRVEIREKAATLEPKINQALTDIGDISNSIELQNYEKNISEELKPYLAQRLAERKLEVNEIEKEEIDKLNEEFKRENENNEAVGGQPNETLTTQISDVENHEQTTEVNLKAEVTNSESQNNSYKNDHISNHRTISKVEKTDESKGVKSGDKISYVNQEWIDYENIPVDKTGTELHFSLNEKGGYNNETKLAVKLIQDILNGVPIPTIINRTKTKSLDSLRQFLADYTPLYLGFKDSQTKAPLDVKLVNQNTQGEIDKNQIFLKQKEVRLQIINHILNGGKLEDISTNITAQMPGVLQIDLNEDGTVPENKITNLNYFQVNGLVDDQGNLTNKGFHEIRERLSVVVDFSNLQNAKGELKPLSTKTESFRPKGEFYLEIPKANGEPFYLKLNSKKINNKKAEVIYEICRYRFAPEGVINKGLTLKEVAKTNPDLIELIKTELKQEYDVISKIKNQDDITLKDVIDIIIYDNNASDKVKFNFRGTGIEGQSVLEYGSNTIDNLEELENKKDELIEWITSTKRQNIKMGSPKNIGGINTNSKEYLDYLINNNILNTNAVTFDAEGNSLPTFGGYTNIYWKNLNIKNKVEVKDVVSTKPTQSTNSDILNEGDIIIGIDSNGKESDRIVVKAYNGVIKQDGKVFTKVSEIIKHLNESSGNFDNAKYSLKETSKPVQIETKSQSNIEAKKADINNKIDNLPDNLLFITHITSEGKAEVIYNDNLLMPAGVSSTTGIVDKQTLKQILFDLAEGKSPHRGYLDMFIGAIDKNTLENTTGKSLQDKLENYLDENFIEDVAKTQLPSSLNIGYFTNGVLNTKYDVELKALESENNSENIRKSENNSVSLQNNIEFTHQIDGTEENKQVKEMESKIESKQLNLSEEKIMEFIEEDGFGLLIERYSQEKQIKEDDLTTEDYNKIIESNYTKEQIDKICKN